MKYLCGSCSFPLYEMRVYRVVRRGNGSKWSRWQSEVYLAGRRARHLDCVGMLSPSEVLERIGYKCPKCGARLGLPKNESLVGLNESQKP